MTIALLLSLLIKSSGIALAGRVLTWRLKSHVARRRVFVLRLTLLALAVCVATVAAPPLIKWDWPTTAPASSVDAPDTRTKLAVPLAPVFDGVLTANWSPPSPVAVGLLLAYGLVAAAIAAAADLDVETDERLTEVDFGDWSMTAFEDLDGRADWAVWCAAKAVARPPAGESLMEVQARMVAVVEAARRARPGGRVALVGHGDPLKTVLAYALGSPLDRVDGFDLDPGSVSAVATGDWGLKVLFVNERVR